VQIALQKAGKTIEAVFRATDSDKNSIIDFKELKQFFTNMKIDLSDGEVKNIFSSIDFDEDDKLTYAEFFSDFHTTVESDTITLLRHEKERYESEVRETSRPSAAEYNPGNSVTARGVAMN